MRTTFTATLAAIAFALPAMANPLAPIIHGQTQLAAETERGFSEVETRLGQVDDGFSAVEYHLREGVRRDASIASIASIPGAPNGLSLGLGASLIADHDAPGAAAALTYRTDRFTLRIGAAGPGAIIFGGVSISLGRARK